MIDGVVRAIPVTAARKDLLNLVDEVANFGEKVILTKRGVGKVMVIGLDELESLYETLAIMANPQAMAAIKRGDRELAEGKGIPFREVLKDLGLKPKDIQ